jgi:predicted transcriptional regulator
MAIIQALQRKRLRLSQLSRQLGFTVAETSRHLERLCDVKMIQEDVKGFYTVAPFGALVLSQLSGLGFVTKHQDYFLDYDASRLPEEFIGRVGELSNGRFGGDVFGNLEMMEREFQNAEEFIWVLSDQIIKRLTSLVFEKVKKPFDFRFIAPEAMMPPDREAPLPSTLPGVQKRELPKVDVLVIVTDKAAGFCLPYRNGKMDYRNFNGEDPQFRKWCKDLFLYYWEKATPVKR